MRRAIVIGSVALVALLAAPVNGAAFAIRATCTQADCDQCRGSGQIIDAGTCIAAPAYNDTSSLTVAPAAYRSRAADRSTTGGHHDDDDDDHHDDDDDTTPADRPSRRFVGCDANFQPIFDEYAGGSCLGAPTRRVTIGPECRNSTRNDGTAVSGEWETWRCDERPLGVYIAVGVIVVVVLVALLTCCCCCCCKCCRKEEAAKKKSSDVETAANTPAQATTDAGEHAGAPVAAIPMEDPATRPFHGVVVPHPEAMPYGGGGLTGAQMVPLGRGDHDAAAAGAVGAPGGAARRYAMPADWEAENRPTEMIALTNGDDAAFAAGEALAPSPPVQPPRAQWFANGERIPYPPAAAANGVPVVMGAVAAPLGKQAYGSVTPPPPPTAAWGYAGPIPPPRDGAADEDADGAIQSHEPSAPLGVTYSAPQKPACQP